MGVPVLGGLLGGGGSKETYIQQVPVTPEPVVTPEDQTDTPVDPEALDRARQRARDAEQRKNRRRLRIPLGTGGTGSGLQLS
jgi:hypothetical protein